MIVSALAIFLPSWLTAPAQKVCQAWLAPGGRLTLLAARKIKPSPVQPSDSDGPLTDEQYNRILITLSLKLQELEHENQSLLGIRSAVGPGPVLIPAHVTGFDSLGLPSVEIDRGTDSGLKEGLPVLATIPLDLLRAENIDPKLALAAGMIVGTIDYGLGPYTARVKLVSAMDPKGLFANVVRFVDGRTEKLCRVRLEGTAKGNKIMAVMVLKTYDIKAGDFVVPEDPQKLNLPVQLVLGRVEKVDTRMDNRMLVDLTVKPLFEKLNLNKVYILAPHIDHSGD